MSFGTGFEDQLLRETLSGSSTPQNGPTSSPNPDFERHKSLGNAAFNQQEYGRALVHYAAASEVDPFSPVPIANRAMVYLKMEEWEAAEREASRALILMGDGGGRLKVKVLLRRASAKEGLGRIQEARMDLDEVERLDSGNRELRVIRERLDARGVQFIREMEDNEVVNGRRSDERGIVRTNGVRSERERDRRRSVEMTNGYHEDEDDGLDIRAAVREVQNRLVRQRPTNSLEFDRMWRSLRDEDVSRGHYLVVTVGKEGIEQGVLGMSITAQFFMEAIGAMRVFIEQSMDADAVSTAETLLAFKNVPRFELVVMFLNSNDLNIANALAESLINKGCGDVLAAELRNMF